MFLQETLSRKTHIVPDKHFALRAVAEEYQNVFGITNEETKHIRFRIELIVNSFTYASHPRAISHMVSFKRI
jgi:hypothetical protein